MMSHRQLSAAALAVTLFMLLSVGCSVAATPSQTETPVETAPLQTGDIAPDFSLPDGDGNMISLADQLLDNQLVILVFYNHYT